MAWSGSSVVGEQGSSCGRQQPRFPLYPLVVIGHPGVNARTILLCAALSPADHSKQPEPVADLAYKRPSGVSLWERESTRHSVQQKNPRPSSLDLLGIPGRHLGSSRDDRHKTCCLWFCLHNSPHVDTHHQQGCSPELLAGTEICTTSLCQGNNRIKPQNRTFRSTNGYLITGKTVCLISVWEDLTK